MRGAVVMRTVALAITFTASLSGCSSADVGAELSSRPKPVALNVADGAVTRLPQDQKFTITLAPSSKEPGLGGSADADAHARAEGAADAMAQVANGGKASASFQLGHAFQNDSNRQIDAEMRVRFKYALSATTDPPSEVLGAAVGLKLYARNAKNLLVRTLDLLGHSTANGPTMRSGENEFTCTLTVGPGDFMNVFLSGGVSAEAREGRSSAGSLKLTDVQLEITSKPAPAVHTSDVTTRPAPAPRTPGDGPQ
jgi:hypothetical protein